MTDREPLLTIHQPPQETVEGALRNALQIAQLYGDPSVTVRGITQSALQDVARLLRHALAGLSEPNEAAISAALCWVPATVNADRRYVGRDCAAAILNAQLKGENA